MKNTFALDAARIFYRNIIVESLLLTSVFIQIITGSKLLFTKRKTVTSFFPKLQLWTGFYLAVFLLIHVGAVLAGRFVLQLDTNFYFGVAGLNTFPLNLFFIPYYGLAILAFFGHLAAIHQQKMKKVIFGLSPTQQAQLILLHGVLILFFIFYGLTSGFSGTEIPEAYQVLVGK
ncbi:MAG: hypothetical protein AAFO82_15780 [Bacteroidota bacterium]